ncbi:hypothetical protein A2U01_0118403 [Trifolium medium]|uniref:Uncharacterized protein n=1 Tax=Trifolium medium TaxID=97028 RepID=A0A392WBB6_9FABA|nr:hypothetical protein [Trifolium medium]
MESHLKAEYSTIDFLEWPRMSVPEGKGCRHEGHRARATTPGDDRCH